jgi:hypothetical protein
VSRGLALALALAAFAVPARAGSSVRKVLKTETAQNSATGDGTLTVVDGAGKKTEFSVNGATKVMRDGKKTTFDTALIGDLVIRAKFDPKTKKLSILELKSSAEPAAKTGPAR